MKLHIAFIPQSCLVAITLLVVLGLDWAYLDTRVLFEKDSTATPAIYVHWTRQSRREALEVTEGLLPVAILLWVLSQFYQSHSLAILNRRKFVWSSCASVLFNMAMLVIGFILYTRRNPYESNFDNNFRYFAGSGTYVGAVTILLTVTWTFVAFFKVNWKADVPSSMNQSSRLAVLQYQHAARIELDETSMSASTPRKASETLASTETSQSTTFTTRKPNQSVSVSEVTSHTQSSASASATPASASATPTSATDDLEEISISRQSASGVGLVNDGEGSDSVSVSVSGSGGLVSRPSFSSPRASKEVDFEVSVESGPLGIEFSNATLAVTSVTANSEADKSGVFPGCRLTFVNGEAASRSRMKNLRFPATFTFALPRASEEDQDISAQKALRFEQNVHNLCAFLVAITVYCSFGYVKVVGQNVWIGSFWFYPGLVDYAYDHPASAAASGLFTLYASLLLTLGSDMQKVLSKRLKLGMHVAAFLFGLIAVALIGARYGSIEADPVDNLYFPYFFVVFAVTMTFLMLCTKRREFSPKRLVRDPIQFERQLSLRDKAWMMQHYVMATVLAVLISLPFWFKFIDAGQDTPAHLEFPTIAYDGTLKEFYQASMSSYFYHLWLLTSIVGIIVCLYDYISAQTRSNFFKAFAVMELVFSVISVSLLATYIPERHERGLSLPENSLELGACLYLAIVFAALNTIGNVVILFVPWFNDDVHTKEGIALTA